MNSLDNAIAEMMLLLHLNPEEIPALEHVKEFTDHIALGALIPVCFQGEQYRAVQALSDDSIEVAL